MTTDGQITPAPLVSVILPTFNRLQYLLPAVESVFAQTLPDWELIIADDGSGGETRDYLKTLQARPRVRVLWLTHTGNYSAVRNAALREARGEYVAFLDSDDVWMPEKLELQVEALKSSATRRWNYTGHRCIDDAGKEITLPGVPKWVPYAGAISEQVLRDQALVCTPSVVAARELVLQAGCFDEQQTLFEDYDLWLRLLASSEVGVVDKPLVHVRKHEQNSCGRGVDMVTARERVLGKLHTVITDRGLLRTIDRLRAVNATILAGAYADSDRVLALRTLCGTAPYAWKYAGWWVRACRVFLKVILPRRVVAFYRLGRQRDPALERG